MLTNFYLRVFMDIHKSADNPEEYSMSWQRIMFQACLIMFLGGILALASLFNGNTVILFGNNLSWLPMSGMLLSSLGLLECLEAKLAKNHREFQQNLQVGVLDTVIGGMTFLSVGEELVRFSMMLGAFLITRGIVRITLVFSLKLPNPISTILAGIISIATGWMIWQEWPIAEGWFLSLCVNIEILFRGWAMLMFSFWLKNQRE
jgi:uncharacterized membrane protein HdeD (DUF308 family)